jgi:membrane-bound lytic murein transglycosylase D
MKRWIIMAVASLVLFTASWLHAEPAPAVRKSQSLEKKVSELEREVDELRTELHYLKIPDIPDQVTLCGRSIPLARDDVRERFEREFYLNLEHKGQLTTLVKRYNKFLSVISDEINRMHLPPDLIYLAIAESALNPRTNSRANAGGLWQFIKETGKREGLFISDQVDERYSVTRSTECALSYLKKLYDEFGDWFVAMAAYNAGEARLREAFANQNVKDYFDLFLNEETDRYVYRIAVIKELVSNPETYGLMIGKKDYYRPYSVAELVVNVEKEVHTCVFAQAMDLPYKTFRDYNLHIRRYRLPKGSYHLYVPVEKRQVFLSRIKAVPGVTAGADTESDGATGEAKYR